MAAVRLFTLSLIFYLSLSKINPCRAENVLRSLARPDGQSDTPSPKSKSPATPSQVVQNDLAQTKKIMDDALDRIFAMFFPARIIVVERSNGVFNTLSIREVKTILEELERLESMEVDKSAREEEEEEQQQHIETMRCATPLCPRSNDTFYYKPYSCVPRGFHAGMSSDTTFNDVVNATVFRMLSSDMPAFRDYNFCESGSGECELSSPEPLVSCSSCTHACTLNG